MGKLDGINIHHTDQYHKKNEDIDMKGRRIDNLKTVCMTDHTTNLSYAINMKCLLNYTYTQLSETLFWEYYQGATAFYKIDIGNSNEVTFDSVRSVSKIFDQSLSQDHAEQTTYNLQPTLCTKSNRVNKRYYLEFNGSQRMISDINLNVASGDEDIVNVFIVYQIKGLSTSYWTSSGLFGQDAMGFHRFISFSHFGDLIISSTVNDMTVIGKNVTNGRTPISDYQPKAHAGELNKWICLSVHWNVPSETSYVYCNGKKFGKFSALSRIGSSQMTFADINPNGKASLNGYISSFLLYKNKRMTSRDILLHHSVLCKWYGVDHDPITF